MTSTLEKFTRRFQPTNLFITLSSVLDSGNETPRRLYRSNSNRQFFFAERILGGDIPASSIAKLLRKLRSFTSNRLSSTADSLCLGLRSRYEARLTKTCFPLK